MRPLLTLSARFCAITATLVLAAGIAAGAIRLLPWFVAPDVPYRLAAPFARVLLLGAAEMTLLVSLPIGVAVAMAVFVERGEARALSALGVSPAKMCSGLALYGLAFVVFYTALAGTPVAEPPGRLAARLLAAGRASCAEDERPRRVDVPLVALGWLCFREGPKLAGRLPGLAREVWFTADDVELDANLRALGARGLSLATHLGARPVHLRVGEARVRGLRGWGRSRATTGAVRAGLVGGAALATALAAAVSVLRAGRPGPVMAGALSGVAAATMAFVLTRLDAREAAPLAYGLVPAAGIAVSAGAFALFRAITDRFVAGANLQ